MLLVIFLVFSLSSCISLSKCDCNLLKIKESIMPDIVSKVPLKKIQVSYHDTYVTCGQDLDIAVTKDAPEITYKAHNIEFYSLVMIDPDAPDPHRPIYSPFLHWLVVNIPNNQVKKGKELKPYFKPSPPPYSAPHRYIFLVFRQQQYVFNPMFALGKGRSLFSFADMKKEMNFQEVVAGNFFYTHS